MKKVVYEEYFPNDEAIMKRLGVYLDELYGNEKAMKRLKGDLNDIQVVILRDIVENIKRDLAIEAMEKEIEDMEAISDLRNDRRNGLVRFA